MCVCVCVCLYVYGWNHMCVFVYACMCFFSFIADYCFYVPISYGLKKNLLEKMLSNNIFGKH